MPSFSLTRMILEARFDTCAKKGGEDKKEGIIWGAGTGVLNSPSSSVLPTDSIIPSPDKDEVFPYFYDATTYIASTVPSPSSDTFSLASPPFLPSLWQNFPTSTPSSSTFEGSLMFLTKLSVYQCALFTCLCLHDIWDWTGTSLSSLFLFFLISDVLGASHLAWLPRWLGHIYPVWYRDNDLSRPRMGKTMIYQVQSRSERFRTTFQTKLHYMIIFDTGTYFACVWHIPKLNQIRNKYNPLNSFALGGFLKENFGSLQNYDT